MREKMKKGFEHWHVVTVYLMIYDAIAINLSYFLALWLRFDCRYTQIGAEYIHSFARFAPIYTVICLIVFLLLKLYRSIWRFASFNELVRVIIATAVTGILHTVLITAIFGRMPISYYLFGMIIQFILVLGVRFAYRFYLTLKSETRTGRKTNVMLIGAGAAGQMILKDIQSARESEDKVLCIIDDNKNKWQRYINGVPIVGGREDILANCEKYKIEKIYIAIPSASPADKRDILNICKETKCELKNLPSIYQLVSGEVTIGNMKDVAIEDLLGRDPIKVNMDEVFDFIKGKTILVTGGGGSIGSELCRQIAYHSPKKLIVFDIYENNAYDIQLELRDKYPDLDLEVLIGSVRDSRRMNQIFEDYHPDIVYHAAAHKHVPLMEDSPCEAIKDNTMGTYKTAYAAMTHGCKKFVLISTDKAVNPTNIMGASKRLCEMVVQTFDRKIREGKADELPRLFTHGEDGDLDENIAIPQNIKTDFVAVRFGNVLGSNGSVIPIFKKQIAKGGPVTVTHPDIVRYFMTIPEAVSLVLQAGTYAKGGEIFVLDMGSPVKIDLLARNLIKLSGYTPDVDIKVEYTGGKRYNRDNQEKRRFNKGCRGLINFVMRFCTGLKVGKSSLRKI